MSPIPIRHVPNSYGLKWLACAWHFARTNYKISMVTSLIATFLLYGVGFLPWIGGVLTALLAPLVSLGLLRLSEKMHRRETPQLKDLFFAFEDQTVAKTMVPLMAIGVVLTLIGNIAPNVSPGLGILIFFTVLILESFVVLAAPLIYYRKLSAEDAIKASFNALVVNAVPYLVYGLIALAILVFAGLLLAIPLVFAVMPATVSLQYLQYQSIFEGLDIDALEQELEARKA